MAHEAGTARGTGASKDPRHLLPSGLAVLVAANVLNNRVVPRLAPVTSAVAAGTLLYLARRSGVTWREMGFGQSGKGSRIGGALAAAVTAAYAGGVLLPATRRLFHDERALGLSRARLAEEILVQVPVGTVLLEEIAFRGVLPAVLRRSHGPAASVAGSSALFGLWHVLPALDMAAANPALGALAAAQAPPPEDRGTSRWRRAARGLRPRPGAAAVVAGTVVSTGLAGVFFHELRRRGGLLAPSLTHLATNSLGFIAARAAARLPVRPEDQGVGTTRNDSA
ncbi:CPBP family intramembrane glutamic endopeptidase [Sphaerisporangium aureirubrum]|uniref:CPBP family intramembrane glutamic endopeptidase n=1 Tax=Sphaerisporangium aureirubrum TaxID=1544736 RepID=A0ABW1NBH6_9ACTN